MKVFIFDTETTGLPIFNASRQYFDPSETANYDGARIIEIAYHIIDQTINEDGVFSFKPQVMVRSLVKFEGVDIQNSHIHGITTTMVNEGGISTEELLNELETDFNDIDRIVAHNIKFDIHILLSECHRFGRTALIQKILQAERACTMASGRYYMDYEKNPKLSELFEFMFHFEFKNQHSALSDCNACLKCYKQLVRKKIL
jgi:DNA polymerase III epsilon subunit-like protein